MRSHPWGGEPPPMPTGGVGARPPHGWLELLQVHFLLPTTPVGRGSGSTPTTPAFFSLSLYSSLSLSNLSLFSVMSLLLCNSPSSSLSFNLSYLHPSLSLSLSLSLCDYIFFALFYFLFNKKADQPRLG
jgi:hypothetical protein